ncbi:inhibitor of growth protein 2 [Rhodnius prolixus]|uniref:Inhibitor of growth protein n=2 Tax=Rhodnius TaxID=13248 RepID=R4FNE4_RHOPR
MLNQAAVDALYSATYVENYLDCVENLPDDVQRYLSRLHELDISYRGYLKDVDNYREALEKEDLELHSQRKTLYKLEQVLISLQEVGDEKVEIGQLINDLIDNKYRQLDQDLKNLDFYKVQEAAETNQPLKENVRESSTSNVGASGATSGTGGGNGSSMNGNCVSGERSSKRARRSRADVDVNESQISETRSKSSVNKGGGSNSSSNHVSAGNSGTGGSGGTNSGTSNSKKKKRKSRQSQREETPPPLREEEVTPHDIDEPTYCLCDQISYGEMILCDNDLCPIEWFHFVCVSLTTKPKGKWFCPKCRGDRPNVMKPKSQFLKELERYNKEKEEKA